MRENRLSGSEGGAALVVPTPIYHSVPPGQNPVSAYHYLPRGGATEAGPIDVGIAPHSQNPLTCQPEPSSLFRGRERVRRGSLFDRFWRYRVN
jgi:hypothetical protein